MQIWNEDGSRMAGFITKEEIKNFDNQTFFIGSCSYKNSFIIVGCSIGCISVLSFSDEKSTSFHIENTIYSSIPQPIAVICSYKDVVFSCNEAGQGVFWEIDQNRQSDVIEGSGVAATVGVSLKKYAIIGFGNGEVRIFNMKTRSLLYNIWSHTRWITGICKHSTRPIFATCSEDGCVVAWALRNGEIETVGNKEYSNSLITGIAFVKENVYMVVYDRAKLIIDSLF